MCLSLAPAISTTFALYTVRALLMSPMKEEMTKFAQMKPLSPQGHRSVDYKTSKCEDRRWTSSSRGGSELKNIVCLELNKLQFFKTSCPSVPRLHAAFCTAVPAFGRGDDVKNCHLLYVVVCTAKIVQRQSTHTCTEPASK